MLCLIIGTLRYIFFNLMTNRSKNVGSLEETSHATRDAIINTSATKSDFNWVVRVFLTHVDERKFLFHVTKLAIK